MFNFHYTLYEQISSSWSQAVVWRCSIKKFLKIPESFFRESRYLIACDIVKKGTPVQRFLCEFCWILLNYCDKIMYPCIYEKNVTAKTEFEFNFVILCPFFIFFVLERGRGGGMAYQMPEFYLSNIKYIGT